MRTLARVFIAGVVLISVRSARPVLAACHNECDCPPCPTFVAYDGIHGIPNPNPPFIERCWQASNPPGCTSAKAWASELGLRVDQIYDDDKMVHEYWFDGPFVRGTVPDCQCEPRDAARDDVYRTGEGEDGLVLTWSGFVDLTHVGTYTLTATITDSLRASTTGRCPCPQNVVDTPLVISFTISVVDCWEWVQPTDVTESSKHEGDNSAPAGAILAGWDSGGGPDKAFAQVWGHPGLAVPPLASILYSSFTGWAKTYTQVADGQALDSGRHTKRWHCNILRPDLCPGPPFSRFRVDVTRKGEYISHGNPNNGIISTFGSASAAGKATQKVSVSPGNCGASSTLNVGPYSAREGVDASGSVTLTMPPAVQLGAGLTGTTWDTGTVPVAFDHFFCEFHNMIEDGTYIADVAAITAQEAEADASADVDASGASIYISSETTSFVFDWIYPVH